MNGEMIEFLCQGTTLDGTYQGYLSRSSSGSGPGIIVLQEWWGLVGHIKNVTDRFAAEGFTALAPDLYKGETTTEPDEAGSLMMALSINETEKVLRCAVDRLLEDASTTGEKVGVVGFCMGGQLSLYAAATNDKIGACVDYYGIHPNVEPPLHQLEAPVLGFFAEHDEYASPEAVRKLGEELSKHGKCHEFHTYPGTHHAFFNDDRPEVYNPAAAEDTWRRMIDFFRQNLTS
jgi:carboxymethylenebutenolidase